MSSLPMLSVAIEDPAAPDAVTLLAQSDAHSALLYPPESRHQADIRSLRAPNVRFFVARIGGTAVACGALVLDGDGTAELKRMFVDPAVRGQGTGRAVLQTIEAAARSAGVQLLRLETGIHNAEALCLYRSFGYVERRAFGDYPDDPLSVFMQKAVV